MSNKNGFGTAPVFFTAISTILGAILFLRFGFAVGTLGFWGVFIIIIIGHLVTIPTALAISEIATNQKVEGGGEYFIISRSFGLNIGATIGIALYMSQAISVAFYVIAFTEAFEPFFNWVNQNYNILLPRQVISIPVTIGLAVLIIKKGAALGVKALYVVVVILFISLIAFFLGSSTNPEAESFSIWSDSLRNSDSFFIVFAICFPAFTGMTAGVGLSGDLRDPKKSIPLGTLLATLSGMVVYIFIIWKLSSSASIDDLVNSQLIMGDIAISGKILIPLGLAASTLSSAVGSILVAPRTLQAIGLDKSFPIKSVNKFTSSGIGTLNEPRNASIITSIIALVIVFLGDVNAVASIISMFFMVTYGSICLISFLHHFGSDPSYRPKFKSKWYLSFLGFVLSVWLMFQMNFMYASIAIIIMIFLYLLINKFHKNRRGLEVIFQGAVFQLIRSLQVFIQNAKRKDKLKNWRPSVVCVSKDTFERDKVFEMLKWVAYKYGFGTYIHLIEGYYSKVTFQQSEEVKNNLIKKSILTKGNIFVDTMISPSFTSAIAQTVQLPSPAGMENNMILLDYDKGNPKDLNRIIENLALIQAGNFDVCLFGNSTKNTNFHNGIHVWLRNLDKENSNLMILLSYVILGHPDWEKGFIKIFSVCNENDVNDNRQKLDDLMLNGRLPITEKNLQIVTLKEGESFNDVVNNYSSEAGLTILGFQQEVLRHEGELFFEGYNQVGDILFVDSHDVKNI